MLYVKVCERIGGSSEVFPLSNLMDKRKVGMEVQ
jgi:hypothetical protein